jgi:hypothetical protein
MLSNRYPRPALDGRVDQTILIYNGHEVVPYTVTRLEFLDAILREEREGVQSPPTARQFMNRWSRGSYNPFDEESATFMQLSDILGEFPDLLEKAYSQAIIKSSRKRKNALPPELVNDILEAGNFGYEFACAQIAKAKGPLKSHMQPSLEALTPQHKNEALNVHILSIAALPADQTMYLNYVFGALHHMVVNKGYSYNQVGVTIE